MANPIIKYGLIAGLVYILRTVLMYIIGISSGWVLNTVLGLLFFIVVVYLAYLAVKEFRSANGDRINFNHAFGTSISVFLITILMSVLFSYIMFQVIDPDYPERMKMETMQMMEERFDKAGLEGPRREEALEKIENKDFSMSLSNMAKTTAYSIGIFGVVALIMAASVKKDLNEQPADI